MLKKYLVPVFISLIILIVYKAWFLPGTLAGGDFQFNFFSMYSNYPLYPYAWRFDVNNGLGGFSAPLLWSNTYFAIPVWIGELFRLQWGIVERFGYFFPFLFLSILTSWYGAKMFFKSSVWCFLSVLIVTTNTYILMLISGQPKVAVAYAFMPLTLTYFIRFIHKVVDATQKHMLFKNATILGLIIGIQIFLDPRIFYVAMVAIVLYLGFCVTYLGHNGKIRNTIFLLFATFLIAVLLNSFWLYPTVFTHRQAFSSFVPDTGSFASLKYFSFATFENSFSLLHPNWPENIFGKVYFMRPEFLILPLLAFVSLLFIQKLKIKNQRSNYHSLSRQHSQDNLAKNETDHQKYAPGHFSVDILIHENHSTLLIIYFELLGLLGAFLAKGVNEPFGGIYYWLFLHIPGFSMFRDSTKWYVLVAISYSVLIPFSLIKGEEYLQQVLSVKYQAVHKKYKRYMHSVLLIVFILFWLFLIRQAFLGQVNGNLKSHGIPQEYYHLERLLNSDKEFSRTLWLPQVQRYGYVSENHPAITANDFFHIYSNQALAKRLQQKDIQQILSILSVKYLIIPHDSEEEIFLKDGKYNSTAKQMLETSLQKMPWLRKVTGFKQLDMYELQNYTHHLAILSSRSSKQNVTYKKISPIAYQGTVSNVFKGDTLLFSESYDNGWIAKIDGSLIKAGSYGKLLTSFTLPKDGSYTVSLSYQPQKLVNAGAALSMATLGVVIVALALTKKSKRI